MFFFFLTRRGIIAVELAAFSCCIEGEMGNGGDQEKAAVGRYFDTIGSIVCVPVSFIFRRKDSYEARRIIIAVIHVEIVGS
jgi:hypothetical protein